MSWLQTYTLRLRKHERSTTTGRVVFVIQLQLGQQEDSQARDVAKRSYSEFRALWKDLVRTTSASISDGATTPRGRSSIRSTRLSISRESWSSVSRLLTGAFSTSGSGNRGSEIDRSSRNKKHCRCTQTSCPFQRLYHLLKDFPFPRKQLLQHKDLEQRRVALEQFLIQLQHFFCGYPRSFLETAASTQRCEVLKLISHFAGMDTRLASLSAINEAFTTDSRPERKRYYSYCVSPVASPSASLTRLTDTTDNTEETIVNDERLSDNQVEQGDHSPPQLQAIVQSSTRSSSTVLSASPPAVLPQLHIKSANVKTFTTTLDEVKDTLVREMGSEVQAAIERDQLSVEEQWEFALFHAAETGQYSDVVTILRRGTNVNGKAWSEATPLHAASGAGHVHVVQCLLSHGAAVDLKGPMGMTPLMCAANNAQLETTKLLLRAGADINQCNARNVSVVHLAVASHSLPMLLLLLDHGARVDIANSVNGRTPLHIAAEAGNKEICEILLKYGARVSQCNASGRNACDVAVEHGRWSVQELCSQHRSGGGGGATTTTLLEEMEEDDECKYTRHDDDESTYSPLLDYINEHRSEDDKNGGDDAQDVAIVTEEGTVYAVL